jgi:hypothetical protein
MNSGFQREQSLHQNTLFPEAELLGNSGSNDQCLTEEQRYNLSQNYVYMYNSWLYATEDECGRTLCNAVGCRQSFALIYAHKARWCAMHHQQICAIRSRITHTTSIEEFYARAEELALRKDWDQGHLAYCYKVGYYATTAQTQEVYHHHPTGQTYGY